MKVVSLETQGLSLQDVLKEADAGNAVMLTTGGQTRYALVPADDGDREALALASNAEFMAYLAECEQRARERPRKSLREVRAMFGEQG